LAFFGVFYRFFLYDVIKSKVQKREKEEEEEEEKKKIQIYKKVRKTGFFCISPLYLSKISKKFEKQGFSLMNEKFRKI